MVDLEGLRGYEQKGCGEMHGVWVAASAAGEALQERLLLDDLALSSPEQTYARAASVRAAFCLKFAKLEMARAKTRAKRVQNRGIAGVDIFAMLEASYAGREVSEAKKQPHFYDLAGFLSALNRACATPLDD